MQAIEPTREELLARLRELEGERELEFTIGEKGGVCVRGLGRFPVTLYYEQWKRLIAAIHKLDAFLEANKHRLKMKGGR